jgi:hypothetical protein
MSAKEILSRLEKANSDVKLLEAEYRKVCECNEKIPGAKFDEKSWQTVYKTCRYHEVRYYHSTETQNHARV